MITVLIRIELNIKKLFKYSQGQPFGLIPFKVDKVGKDKVKANKYDHAFEWKKIKINIAYASYVSIAKH